MELMDRIEGANVMDIYSTVSEGVTPYSAKIGDRVILFTRRANAKLQTRLASVQAETMGPQHVGLITDLLAAMMDDSSHIDFIMEQLDLSEVARLMNNATKAMTAEVPTTGQPHSSSGLSMTGSATGSREPESAERS